MSDERNDKLNTPSADEPSYSVDEILSEFSSFRSQRVVPFPTQEESGDIEDTGELPADPMPRRRAPEPRQEAEIIGVPLSLLLKEKVRSLFRRADEYADQMYQQAEPTPDELEAEELIPGVDLEEPMEEEPAPRRLRRKPAALPHDTAPADLAAHDPGLLRSVVTFELWLCLLAAMLMLVDIAVRRLTLADIRRMFSRQPSEK